MSSARELPEARADANVKNLLDTLFASLRELYVYCESRGQVSIAGEVVDALCMCQQDFVVLVDQLQARCDGDRRRVTDGVPSSLSAAPPSTSPTQSATASSPLAQINSPDSNSRMLMALESLKLDELQEAARYFEVAGPMLPRKAHEALYLERAAAEGREAVARRFLVTLNRMAASAAERRGAERPHSTDGPSTAPPGAADRHAGKRNPGDPGGGSADRSTRVRAHAPPSRGRLDLRPP